MCHSTWEKTCFAWGPGESSPGEMPRSWRKARPWLSVRTPGAAGSSHRPASKPFSGRFCKATRPWWENSKNRVRSSCLRGLALAFTGSSWATPWAAARHTGWRGHPKHRGAPPGKHTKAPSSIRDWLKSLTRWGSAWRSSSSVRRLTLASKILSYRHSTREMTRSTLPSTAGTGS